VLLEDLKLIVQGELMITLVHSMQDGDETFNGQGIDIINPDHIVNVMSNNMESHTEVEFTTHRCTIYFLDDKSRLEFLDAVSHRNTKTIKIKKLSNTHSRWLTKAK